MIIKFCSKVGKNDFFVPFGYIPSYLFLQVFYGGEGVNSVGMLLILPIDSYAYNFLWIRDF